MGKSLKGKELGKGISQRRDLQKCYTNEQKNERQEKEYALKQYVYPLSGG